METKKTLQIPDGFEFDHVDSDGVIHVKAKTPPKSKYPLNALDCYEVHKRVYYINTSGEIVRTGFVKDQNYINSLPTEEYAKAFLALMQLITLRDAWNKVDGFIINWENGSVKYCIINNENNITSTERERVNVVLAFGKEETRDKFMEQFADLIKKAKPLL